MYSRLSRTTGQIAAVAAIALTAGACGMLAGGSGISVTYDGGTDTVEAKDSRVFAHTIGDSVAHTFVIANYDLPEKLDKRSAFKSAKEDGRKRVEFTIIGEKRTNENTPLKPGEYPARVGSVGSPVGTANDGKIAFNKDGKEDSQGLNMADMKEGKVVIESVEGGTVKGTVEITDGDMTIKGSFTAKSGS